MIVYHSLVAGAMVTVYTALWLALAVDVGLFSKGLGITDGVGEGVTSRLLFSLENIEAGKKRRR
jgi:hypothetical protein